MAAEDHVEGDLGTLRLRGVVVVHCYIGTVVVEDRPDGLAAADDRAACHV
jgi:hypothetical protein